MPLMCNPCYAFPYCKELICHFGPVGPVYSETSILLKQLFRPDDGGTELPLGMDKRGGA